jgi:stringent starvation protein B
MVEVKMTASRPYLIRAMHEWILDNNLTPHILVNAKRVGVDVPPSVIKEDGQVVLNLAPRAIAGLDLGNEYIRFNARFNGLSHTIFVPPAAVLAIYAQENGQGMMFPADEEIDEPSGPDLNPPPRPTETKPEKPRPKFTVVK